MRTICESNEKRLQQRLDGKIAFYLDGVSFIHKYNPFDQARAPKGKVWLRPHKGLACGCTAKCAHCGGHLVKFLLQLAMGKELFFVNNTTP